MGRQVKRVPMDFYFPIGASWADAEYDKHCATCPKEDHDDCDWPHMDGVPEGEGWQLWQTVSDGPISPVFATADELIDWMCQPVPKQTQDKRSYVSGNRAYPDMPWDQGWRREIAEPFVKCCGWAPSMVVANGVVMDGATHAVKTLEPSK